MGKRLVVGLVVALLAATCGVLGSSDAFGATVTCTGTPGTLAGTTINANVTVPSGSWCKIQGQTVNGNINVSAGGGLLLKGSTVNGTVTATSPGSFVGNPCGGGSGHFSVVVDSSTITGTFTVTGASSDVVLGGLGCRGSTFHNNVYVNNNRGLVHVEGNTVDGNLYVQGNTGPTPVVTNNKVSNQVYCSPASGPDNSAKRISGSCTGGSPPVPQGSCAGSSSLSTFVNPSGSSVTAYIPKGNWGSGATGIDVVNVEGSSITNTKVPTGTDVINSAATNPVTGQTVATANNNHVYVLKGTGLDPSVSPNPLTDAGTGTISFSGGDATTTGVSMDAVANKALLGLSIGGKAGFQFLNLATHTFEPAFTSKDPDGEISENPLVDPVRHLVLSAAEDSNFEIVNVSTSTAPKFFEHPVARGGELDSTSEDCSTGIVLAPAEFSSPSNVEIADITSPPAVFTSGSPGSWTAPEQVQSLAGSSLSAGASGSGVAQGTHTGVISGEFGGDALTSLALPTTSGSGAIPAISNWVTCHTGQGFSMGLDPHTLAAYQTPNGGDAIALLVNDGATQMVRVDLTKMLNPSIAPATGKVCNGGTLPASVVTSFSLP